jgi:hypothetical protein
VLGRLSLTVVCVSGIDKTILWGRGRGGDITCTCIYSVSITHSALPVDSWQVLNALGTFDNETVSQSQQVIYVYIVLK